MRRALESLPWVKKVTVSYAKQQATLEVVSAKYDEPALLKALTAAGFGAKVSKKDTPDPDAKQPEGKQIAFQVSGMQKTKSGAT